VDQKLIVAPGINDYADLKGKIFAVDAPTTGYAIVGVYIMKQHGLEWHRDYTMKSFGNTAGRANAMSRGEASGAMMNLQDEEIKKRNFKVLAQAQDYVKHYARGLAATRRQWANANEDLAVRFTRAMIRASDWVQDPRNKQDAIQLLLGETKNNKGRAEALYQQALSPTMGITPRSRIDYEGIRQVILLREAAGLMKAGEFKAEKYVDERFYNRALSTIDAR
jgi:ABC-type nitrate/sulfonate/bicarbonate transport system substrate-binding protein